MKTWEKSTVYKQICGINTYVKQEEDAIVKEWSKINKDLFEIKNMNTGVWSSKKGC